MLKEGESCVTASEKIESTGQVCLENISTDVTEKAQLVVLRTSKSN